MSETMLHWTSDKTLNKVTEATTAEQKADKKHIFVNVKVLNKLLKI